MAVDVLTIADPICPHCEKLPCSCRMVHVHMDDGRYEYCRILRKLMGGYLHLELHGEEFAASRTSGEWYEDMSLPKRV